MKRYYLWLRSPADEAVAIIKKSNSGDLVKYEDIIRLINGEIVDGQDMVKRTKDRFDEGIVYGLQMLLELIERD